MIRPDQGMHLAHSAPSGPEGRLTQVKLKSTSARVRVLGVLQGHDHLSPEQIHLLAERSLPGLSLSTVYRTLDTLLEVGLIGFSHLSGSSRSYHLAEHRGHTHLSCQACGASFVVPSQVTDDFAEDLAANHGFHLDVTHLVVTGRCTDCAAGPDAS